jgi:hypothetical protein
MALFDNMVDRFQFKVVVSRHAVTIPINKRRSTMMKITTLFTALILAFAMNAFAVDKVTEPTAADTKPAVEKKVDVKKADGKMKTHHRNHYWGEVTAVDAKAGTVTISRGEKTFAADEKLLSDVKVGDKVSVKFTKKDGKLTATAIKPAKAHHMKKEAKEAAEKKPEVKPEEKK